ncbi:interleukin-17 receptor A [Rhinoderma darwinii]|uniref:interleukin-17 receptor A n=1 Tax=Rhinoderma darwinii TaxID=43563 RepID=UPI003F67B46F
MGPALRLCFFAGMMCGARGLRIIDSPDFNCSQPGIQCRVLNSNCLDLSWIQSYNWTPTAPSHLEVTAGIALNDLGYRVPVLQISWTVSIDSGILKLQGAEISVLELSTSLPRCVQFQFGNTFPKQRDQNNQAWKFFYNNFEVNPGNKYHISVQHLPKEGTENRRDQEFTAPGCSEDGMMQTDACCKLGHCWNPNITLEFTESKLIVAFTPRRDAHKYGVQVRISRKENILWSEIINLQQGATTERAQLIISNPVSYEPCWYNVSVWPYMQSCETDCVRQWYAPKCPRALTVMTTPAPPGQVYMWPIAAAVTIASFTVTIILLWRYRACISPPVNKTPNTLWPPCAPPLVKQKVWLVYSADHELYISAVIRLADFLRVAWGLDVVLDRLQVQEIGIRGVMAWLSYQKRQIDEVNGTILILCSRGTQAKWRAMQNRMEPRVTLRQDTTYMYGDLFTPALTLILPDFQRANPYDRYVVAYFSELCNVSDIPSPLEICPRYPLIENLHMLLFRIQRIEYQQPNVQYNVDLEGNPSYQHLVKAMEQCQCWQETNSGWFESQCSPAEANEHESIEEREEVGDDEAGHEVTRRVNPQIRRPDTSVSRLTPFIIQPDPIRLVNPSLVVGPSSACMEPLLKDHSSVTIVQPSLNTEASRASYRQQPFLVDVDQSPPIYNERLYQMDLSCDQGVHPEDLSEAQRKFFCQSILEDWPGAPNVAFDAESLLSSEDPRAGCLVEEDESLPTVYDRLLQIDLSIPCDQDVRDLPIPRDQDVRDLPIPWNQDVRDLPIPRDQDNRDLPIPRDQDVRDLPIPRDQDVRDLPIPWNQDVRDLPIPRDQDNRDLPIPRDQDVRDLSIPNNQGIRDLSIPCDRDVRNVPIPSHQDVPDFSLPRHQDVPDFSLPRHQYVPDFSLPRHQDVPDFSLPRHQDVPDFSLPRHQDVPDFSLPRHQDVPDVSLPRHQDVPDLSIPRHQDVPDLSIPRHQDVPDLSIPRHQDVPDLSIPRHQDVPDLSIPRHQDVPDLSIPRHQDVPDLSIPRHQDDRDFYIPCDQDVQDLPLPGYQSTRFNDLMEAQKKFFYQTILESPPSRLHGGDPKSMDLGESRIKWFHHSVLEGQRITPKSEILADEPDIYEGCDDRNLDFHCSRGVNGQTDNTCCNSEDLGYGTLPQ